MKSKTSLLDRAILLNDFKSFSWIAVVYLLGLLFALPLNLYLLYTSTIKHAYQYPNYLHVFAFNFDSSPIALILMIIIPVITGLLLFRYLQSNKSADMVHALPIKRATLYNTHILAGIIILYVPLLITALISWAIVAVLPLKSLSGHDVLVWLGISLLINLLLFMTGVATGMITGMSTVQGVLSYILLFLPTGLSTLLLYHMGIYTYGFAIDYYAVKINFSPLSRIPDFSRFPIQTSEIIAYILISILLYGLGRYLYQRRQLERAGQALSFDILYPLFKYGVTFCFMLLLGAYFFMQTRSLVWVYLAYFLGSLLAYFLMEILFNKSIYVFNRQAIKGYGFFVLSMVILIAALHFDCTGYEKRIPELAEIENVYLDNYFYPLTYQPEQEVDRIQYDDNELSYPPIKSIYKDQANIKRIYNLQQCILANRTQEQAYLLNNSSAPSETICLAYTLKNGQHIYRQYSFTPGKYDSEMKSIYESNEYKRYHNQILNVDAENVNLIEIRAAEVDRIVNISNPEQIRQAIQILQKEVFEQSYAEMKDQRSSWADITIRTNDHRCFYLSWNKSYAYFDQWLKTSGQYEQARIIPERDLDYAIVAKNFKDSKTTGRMKPFPGHPSPEDLSAWEHMPASLKIADPVQLEQCLQKYTNNEQQEYKIMFVLKNGNAFYGYLPEAVLGSSSTKNAVLIRVNDSPNVSQHEPSFLCERKQLATDGIINV